MAMKVKDWLSVLDGEFKIKIGEEPTANFLSSKKDIIDVYGDAELQEVIIDYEKRCTILKIAVRSQCACYRVKNIQRHLSEYEQGVYFGRYGLKKDYIEEKQAYCIGTRECDTCSCDGDRSKCNFYMNMDKKDEKERN